METETVEIKEKHIVIERFSEQLIPQFLELFRASFGKSISEEHLQKKYATENLGGSYFGYMAFHQNKPIAYYGVLPVPFILDEKKLTAVQSADTMTHPDYRRHGLFPLLAKKTYQLAKEKGASFVFGWPNENSYPSFKNKLDWIDLGNMQRFSVKVNTLPLAKLFFKLRFLRPLYMRFAKLLLGINGLEKTEFIEPENCVSRNIAYLKYKEQAGVFSVFSNYGNVTASLDYRLKIGDLTQKQSNSFAKLLNELKRKCFLSGITEIQIIISPNSNTQNILLKAGMQRDNDLPLMYWPFSTGIKIEKLNLTGLDYDGF